MIYIGAFAIIIIISLFFKMKFNFKTEEAMFTALGLIIIVLTIFGLFGLMNIGQYVLYILALFSLLYIIYYLIKLKFKYDYAQIITPGFIVIILSFVTYTIITKNNVLYIWDEASTYGTAAHFMDVTNTISNGGSVTVFTYFFTSFGGYSEHALFVSRWLFIWICITLPLSTLKWDKWYMAMIYAVLAFGVITLIDPETKYLMDAPIGVIAGAAIAYLSISRKKSRNTILTLSCILTLTTKDNVGLVLLGFILMFYSFYYIVELYNNQWKLSKKNIINISIFTASIIITLIIKSKIMPIAALDSIKDLTNNYLPVIVIVLIFIIGFIVLWFVWLNKFVKKQIIDRVSKNLKIKKIIMITFLSILPLSLFAFFYKIIWQILYSLDVTTQKYFIKALNEYFNMQYFGFSITALTAILMIAVIFCVITIIKKAYRVSFVVQMLSIISMIVIYGFIISLIYIQEYLIFLKSSDMMGIERFTGTLIIMICIWLMALAFSQSDYYIDNKKQYIVSFLIAALLIKAVPLPGETMFSGITNPNMIANKYSIRPEVKNHSLLVMDNTPDDAEILIIALDESTNDDIIINSRAFRFWMYYDMVPRPLPGLISNLDAVKAMTKEKLLKMIDEFDYVYIANADDDFYALFGDMFDSEDNYKTKTLYINNRGMDKPLKLVYAEK